MTNETAIRWDRYALIADLAIRLKPISFQFGKTVLQKLVFLLQEIYKIDFDYEYEFYSYGPFTSQLLSDLDQVERFKGVEIATASGASSGYLISPGIKAEAIKKKGEARLADPKVDEAITQLIKSFGKNSAGELELISTIIFTQSRLNKTNELSSADIIKKVKELKPKYPEEYIHTKYSELREQGYI